MTTPSFTSLLTGRYPPSHTVRSLRGCRLPAACPSLVQSFADANYYTFAEVTGPLLESIGLSRGFHHYHCRAKDQYLDGEWGRQIINELKLRRYPEPWLGLVHLWELHAPPHVPESYDNARHGDTRYDRALTALEPVLAELFRAIPEQTTVVLLGDHGESLRMRDLRWRSRLSRSLEYRLARLWEPVVLGDGSAPCQPSDKARIRWARHVAAAVPPLGKPSSRYACYRRWKGGHGWHLYDEAIRVPLLFLGPSVEPRRVNCQVRTVDLLPTLLELAGLRASLDDGLDGHSLVPLMRGEAERERTAYIESGGGVLPDRKYWLCGLRTGGYKYISSPFAPTDESVEELYDLTADPAERRNLALTHGRLVGRLREECHAIALQSGPCGEANRMSSEDETLLEERLRLLGYL